MTNGHRALTPAHGDLPASRLVDLSGDGRARGEAHGETLRPLIDEALQLWRERIAVRHGVSPQRFAESFLAATGFVRTVQHAAPELHREVLGIAAGSAQPIEDIWVYNLMDEEWRFQHGQGLGCSVIAARTPHPDGRVVIGQNMDLPVSMAGSQAVLRIRARDGEPAQIVLTAAGMVGLLGVNALGVACCVNTLKGLPAATSGLPVAFIVRGVLRRADARSAAAYLETVPHASGQHYAIADAETLVGYECSSERCVPAPAANELVHTNHPLWTHPESLTSTSADGSSTSAPRLEALRSVLPTVRRAGDIERALSDARTGLCVRPTEQVPTQTFCGVEFVLSAAPAVRVALGPPDTTTWYSVSWQDKSGPAAVSAAQDVAAQDLP